MMRNKLTECAMPILMWFLGVPISVIILLYLFHVI